MKKFAIKAVAIATGALAAGGALAGSFTLPAAATTYAVEALAPTTAITTPNFVYSMGVGRPIGNGFTIIMTPSAGSTFGTCVVPTYGGASTVSVTVKRFSPSECAYDVQVAVAPVAVLDTFTWTGQTFASHSLANKGNTVGVSINLKDPGETSQVDNPGPVPKTLGTSVQSINVYANTSDTFTVANVNAPLPGGPLTGFVANGTFPNDSGTTARAALLFDHNSVNATDAGGVLPYTFAGTVGLTLTGTTSGAAAAPNGICIDLDNDGIRCEAGEVFTVASGSSTLADVAAGFGAQGSLVNRIVSFLADGTTQLGTSRTFAVSGVVTPTLANTVANALVDVNSKNATWWVWSANASQLMTPYFSTNTQYVTRFSMLNTGSAAVGYTTKCFTEGAAASVAGTPGTLKADGTTVIDASTVCSFTNPPRGAVLFTISAPIGSVKGAYNIVDKVSGSNGFVPMTRPYNNNTTE